MANTFLPNEANRRLFPGFVAFCVALGGVTLGFVASYFAIGWLSRIAFVITVVGVAGGFVFVAHGWWRFFFRPTERDHNGPK